MGTLSEPIQGFCWKSFIFVKKVTRSEIQTNHAVVVDYARIESNKATERRSVWIPDIAQILVFTGRTIAHGNGNRTFVSVSAAPTAERIIKIVSSVVSFTNVGRKKVLFPFAVMRILFCRIYRSVIFPCGQIIHGRRPYLIVEFAERFSARPVARTEYIHSVAENVRLSVRYTYVYRQIRILRLHVFLLIR